MTEFRRVETDAHERRHPGCSFIVREMHASFREREARAGGRWIRDAGPAVSSPTGWKR